MKIAYFALTAEGHSTAQRIQKKLGGIIESKEAFAETVAADFHMYDALVFIMAAGIVVRTIAPLLRSKAEDPAVIVLDQRGQFVISLLSGHLGGANRLTEQIAAAIHAVPIITTATDIQGVIAFDEFAKQNHLAIENLPALKHISSALLQGETIQLLTDCSVDTTCMPPQVIISDQPDRKFRVIVSDRLHREWEAGAAYTLFLRPKNLTIGIGCKKAVSFSHLEQFFLHFLEQHQLSLHSVAAIATIARKAKEPAILELCKKYQIPMIIVSDTEIQSCNHHFEVSPFVQQVTGLPSVAQACSYLASGCGEELTGKIKFSGVTLAACRKKQEPLTFHANL